ncbi:MAG: OmpA family protein [Geminicoccaceae bacterium]
MSQRPALLTMPACRLSWMTAIILAAVVLIGIGPAASAAEKSILLTEVHFDPGSTTVTPGGQQKIKKAIAAIKKQNPKEIRVIGFSDTTGGEEINRKISRGRADNVASLLAEQGIKIPLVIEGMGEEGAPYKIEDDVSEPLNRCVGIIAVGTSQPPKPTL